MVLSATGGTSGTYNQFADFSDYGVADGVTYDVVDITVEALETIDIACTFLVGSSYGFIQWVEQPGSNGIADTESATTTLNITRDNTHVMANVGLYPLSTFLTEGDAYFGETIQLTDVSTAPSGDGTIVSAEYTNSLNIPAGYSAGFDGVNDFFSLSSPITLSASTGYTVSPWVYLTSSIG